MNIGTRVTNHRFGDGTIIGRCGYLYYVRYDSGVYNNESAHYLTVLPPEAPVVETSTWVRPPRTPVPPAYWEAFKAELRNLDSWWYIKAAWSKKWIKDQIRNLDPEFADPTTTAWSVDLIAD